MLSVAAGIEFNWSGILGVSGPLGLDTLLLAQGTGIAETIAGRADSEIVFWHGTCLHLVQNTIITLDSGGLRN